METQKKLEVLAKIAHAFNARQLTWAVGASLLLYCKGIVTEFNDIDLMVAEKDAAAAKTLLRSMGKLQPPRPTGQYRSKCFFEFTIEAVEVDLIAGFVIVHNGEEHAFPLDRAAIVETIDLGGEQIQLQSVVDWRNMYTLMGRTEKVQMIDAALTRSIS